eukprot:CAMPEP_0198679816 /NCGR_PEP_ID=MMETSP1468-20131203/3381_1 /TAXON_ID=1461545 /ORGANISM="Mantoniella sp, Strain CCMP1436" /LENGTH=172 /DNA_ID=CAMNT_0044418981 /DNA_START=86 /DNA_END=604 /DNA_ORIENTATION=+
MSVPRRPSFMSPEDLAFMFNTTKPDSDAHDIHHGKPTTEQRMLKEGKEPHANLIVTTASAPQAISPSASRGRIQDEAGSSGDKQGLKNLVYDALHGHPLSSFNDVPRGDREATIAVACVPTFGRPRSSNPALDKERYASHASLRRRVGLARSLSVFPEHAPFNALETWTAEV